MPTRPPRTITSGKFIMLCCCCRLSGDLGPMRPYLGARIKLTAPHHADQIQAYAATLGIFLQPGPEAEPVYHQPYLIPLSPQQETQP